MSQLLQQAKGIKYYINMFSMNMPSASKGRSPEKLSLAKADSLNPFEMSLSFIKRNTDSVMNSNNSEQKTRNPLMNSKSKFTTTEDYNSVALRPSEEKPDSNFIDLSPPLDEHISVRSSMK